MGRFVLVVVDGDRIRSFHPEAFDHGDRVVVERIAERRLDQVRKIFSPASNGEAVAAAAEVSARASGNGAVVPSSSFREREVSFEKVPNLPLRSSFEDAGTIPRDAVATMVQAEMARTAGFSGNVCADCGSFEMVRSGTCETCKNCGKTSGGCS